MPHIQKSNTPSSWSAERTPGPNLTTNRPPRAPAPIARTARRQLSGLSVREALIFEGWVPCLPCHPLLVVCALIIHLIIQTIGLDPSGAVRTDKASNVSRLDPSGAVQIDAERPSHNRKVEGLSVAVGGGR
jgi:hypothetical protein